MNPLFFSFFFLSFLFFFFPTFSFFSTLFFLIRFWKVECGPVHSKIVLILQFWWKCQVMHLLRMPMWFISVPNLSTWAWILKLGIVWHMEQSKKTCISILSVLAPAETTVVYHPNSLMNHICMCVYVYTWCVYIYVYVYVKSLVQWQYDPKHLISRLTLTYKVKHVGPVSLSDMRFIL